MSDTIRLFFETRAAHWDERMPDHIGAVLRQFAAPLIPRFRAARTILEIGTGTGMFIPILANAIPAAQIVSVDLAGAMLVKARQRCPEAQLAQADVHALPLRAESFDLVICHNSFPHFVDKLRALKEIWQALHPGGTLLVLHNNPRETVNNIHRNAGEPIAQDLLPAGDEMRRLMVEAGYTNVRVEDAPDHYAAEGNRA
jgi:ubiquinone/menaquinone biosynthesis C-methylase UbiE